jgi:spoIIIJ-associated protein
MRSVETDGATIDQAIARALAALGAERDQVEIEILESGSRGLLGLGRRKARVRASMRVPLRAWLEAELESGAERRGDGAGPAPQGASRRAGTTASAAGALDAAGVLRGLLRRMGVEARVVERLESEGTEPVRLLEMAGPASDTLVWRGGEVLDALEHVVNRMLERASPGAGRVTLDAAGFRARRRARLEEMARRAAARARERCRAVTLSPLSPGDRRTVYQALRTELGVSARSVGQGFYRRLVIVPGGVRKGGGKMPE